MDRSTKRLPSLGRANSYDSEKISEFLEKFVNVKIGLYPSSDDLKRFVGENLKLALSGNLQTNYQLLDAALGGLREIYDSQIYFRYVPLVGDIRKIKRLVNTLVLLNIDKADFENTDILPRDLIHLLLVYLNYPATFRQIFNAETHGRSGNFSAIALFDENNKRYANSGFYHEYVKTLDSDGRHAERLLLDQVFDVSQRLEATDASRISEGERHSFACFNSDNVGGRNLETYLNLIVRVSPPQLDEQYKFYSNAKDRIKAGERLSEIFRLQEFSFARSETSHDQLWRVLTNSLREFDCAQVAEMIRFAVKFITQYSALDISNLGLGLRHSTMAFIILRMLDAGGWHDQRGLRRDNSDANIMEIADWIFGLGAHLNEGILRTLVATDRGVLGWHDLLSLRLYCCSDRNSTLFSLQRALALHSDPNSPTTGLTSQIVIGEMREISQETFRLFKADFIDTKRNIFREIDQLSLKELTGEFWLHFRVERDAGRIDQSQIDRSVESCKTAMKAFSIFQLTNKRISSGIGCGYFDQTGRADGGGIFIAMNDYLFEVCFNPVRDDEAYRWFVEYLLAGYQSVFDAPDGRFRKLSIEHVIAVLEPERLRSYWLSHRTEISEMSLQTRPTEVITPNYGASYSEGVPDIIKMLEDFVAGR